VRTRARAIASQSPPTWARATSSRQALADFAVAYADLNERDYNVVVKAVRDGRINAEEGV
jgi:hypothetical protein